MSLGLSAADARRIAIAAQGLATPRPRTVDAAALRAMLDRLSVIQLDSVNVLARSHYLVAWSRLGAYDPALLDRLSFEAPRAAFEYWGHEASLLPVELQPMLRWRMDRARHDAWGRMRAMARRRGFVAKILDAVAAQGPVRVGELAVPTRKAASRGWWSWSDAKIAIEWLFWSGQVTAARRRSFERLYDLPERVLPPEILASPKPIPAEAHRALVERSGRALGVATEADLRDYFRLRPEEARPAILALVDARVLEPVSVEGWRKTAYLHHACNTSSPRKPARAALLSPFDNLVWFRERTERLFGMRFRLEVYTPEPQRIHGYYVLPFLLGDELVARVDLKADRGASTLRVQAAHLEPGRPADKVAAALVRELRALGRWLALDELSIAPRGNLAAALGR